MKKPKQRPWPADKIVHWPLSRIRPYPNNPRSHSPEQVAQIKTSMARYGVTAPILVDEAGEIIYGHGRLLAAQSLNYERMPVVIARGWSDDDKRAYRIADNQLALNAEWDYPLLSSELKALNLAGYDMPVLGFADAQLIQFMAHVGGGEPGAETDEPTRELTSDEKPLMIAAWQKLAGEWLSIIERQELLSTNFTKTALAVHFLRARFFGIPIPAAATLAYTPHRALIAGDRHSIADALRMATTNQDDIIERLWFVIGGQPRLDKLYSGALPFISARMPADFPSELARSLYDEFTSPGGKVLDPCSGWGGRMLGFLLSHASLYHGFDTDERSKDGVIKIYIDLKDYTAGKHRAWILGTPFEDAKLKPHFYDFALTSPPYFNTEKYGGEHSSWRRYQSLEAWTAGFYRPLLNKVSHALKPGATFALQIGNQTYPLEQLARDLAPDCALEHVETRMTDMSAHGYVGLGSDGAVPRDPREHEVIVLLRARRTRHVPKQHAAAQPVAAGNG